jgi:anti-sigma regulatory factor (Ser/Thr protein kinase)
MRQAWLPAAHEGAPVARAIVRDEATGLGLDPTTTYELMLATTEAFANAVEHGKPCDGRGLPIISAIVDDFEVVPEDETTRVRFQKRLALA